MVHFYITPLNYYYKVNKNGYKKRVSKKLFFTKLNNKKGGGVLDQSNITTIIFMNNDERNKSEINKSEIFNDKSINKDVIKIIKWEDPLTMVKYVFPNEGEHTIARGISFSNRPFKACPIKYNKLLEISNKAIFNICVFKENILIGMSVITELDKNTFYINIMCTNVDAGVGKYLILVIKKLTNYSNLLLRAESKVTSFYEKYGFKKIKNFGDEYFGMRFIKL